MAAREADEYLQPVVLCIGDMGAGQVFYIRSNTWHGGNDAVLKMVYVEDAVQDPVL